MTIFCRVCRMQIFSQPILLTSNSARHAKPINEMVFECTQILLTKDIRLPQFLCESCLIRLDEAFAFLKLCRESERMFTETIPMAIKLDNKSDPGNGVSYHSTNAIELTKCFNNSSSEAIKLELEGDDSKAPLEYAATSSTFSDFSALISGGQTTSSAQDNKDWLSEARKHRERQRVSTAKRRANMTPDQRKKERERARIRQAQRRALRSEEQVRAQRERDRVRQAMKRARFRQVEMIQQQHQQQQIQQQPPQQELQQRQPQQQQQQPQQQQQQHQPQHLTFPLEARINQLMS